LKLTRNRQEPFKYGSLGGAEIALVASKTSPIATTSPDQTTGLFTPKDWQKVQTIAQRHKFLLPSSYEPQPPTRDINNDLRKVIGIWASEIGYGGQGRQAMLMIDAVTSERMALGHFIGGPSTPHSFSEFKASTFPFSAKVQGDTMQFISPNGARQVVRFVGRKVTVADTRTDGRSSSIGMEPVWRLIDAGQSQ
jgi:hypothetical protein